MCSCQFSPSFLAWVVSSVELTPACCWFCFDLSFVLHMASAYFFSLENVTVLNSFKNILIFICQELFILFFWIILFWNVMFVMSFFLLFLFCMGSTIGKRTYNTCCIWEVAMGSTDGKRTYNTCHIWEYAMSCYGGWWVHWNHHQVPCQVVWVVLWSTLRMDLCVEIFSCHDNKL